VKISFFTWARFSSFSPNPVAERPRSQDFIASGPHSPQPGAPYIYVTTKQFLSEFGLGSLRDLPDIEALEDAGLLSKDKALAGDLMPMVGGGDEEPEFESMADLLSSSGT
jgi:hypothetical protein